MTLRRMISPLTTVLCAVAIALAAVLAVPVSARADDGSSPIGTITERMRGFQAAQVALAELGVPYSWGGGSLLGPTLGFCDGTNGYLNGQCMADHTVGFDCSGLVRYAWFEASGGSVVLPHYSAAQAQLGRAIPDRSDLLPGDLLFFADPGGPIHHVGLYLGNGTMIHAEHTGTNVAVLHDVFDDPTWGPRLVATVRPEPADSQPPGVA